MYGDVPAHPEWDRDALPLWEGLALLDRERDRLGEREPELLRLRERDKLGDCETDWLSEREPELLRL
jgi:hypothetical protein